MDRREQRFKKRTAVTKEQALNFLCANDAADQNREAHQCGKRNSNGITQPGGAATPRDSDAHERSLSRRLSALFAETPLFRPVSRCVRSCWRRRVCACFRPQKRT